ncbi:hypothetical protein pb186bvf_001480 [Paramecium bursaria]
MNRDAYQYNNFFQQEPISKNLNKQNQKHPRVHQLRKQVQQNKEIEFNTEEQIESFINTVQQNWKKNQALYIQQETLIQSQLKMISSQQYQFICAISKEQIKIPVLFKGCKHINDNFDFAQLLRSLGKVYLEKEIKCPHCTNTFKYNDDIFVPNPLLEQLMEKCGGYSKQIQYYDKEKIIMPTHSVKGLKEYNSDNLIQIYEIYKKGKNQQFSFSSMIKKLEIFEDQFYLNVCFLTSTKVLIPVRGDKCVHLEVYDLVCLMKHLQDKKLQYIQCGRCQQPLSLQNVQIDYELHDTALKSCDFAFQYKWSSNSNRLYDILQMNNRDTNLFAYRQIAYNSIEGQKYEKKIYGIANQIFQLIDDNDKQTKEFYDRIQNEDISKLQLNLDECQFTQSKILIPCRCIKCPQLQVVDLRYMACILDTAKEKYQQLSGVVEQKNKCPLCQYTFVSNPKNPLFKQVYVDRELSQFILSCKLQIGLNQTSFKSYRDKNDNKIKIVEGKSRIESLDIVQMDIKCPLSNQIIRKPVRGFNCKHKECVDYYFLQNQVQQGLDLDTLKCPFCPQMLTFNLIEEKLLTELIQKLGDQQAGTQVKIYPKTKVIKRL